MDLLTLQLGLTGSSSTIVSAENTALRMGSGGLDVFATPAMVALMEEAAISAIADRLPAGWQSVGAHVDVRHIAASPVGVRVTAEAILREVDERRLTFSVKAWDEWELIGEGDHQRVLIDVEQFQERLRSK